MKSTVPAMPVANMDDGVAFYREFLGFEVIWQDGGYAVLGRDDIQLHLWGAVDESWREREGGTVIDSGAESFLAGTCSCRIEVEGIDDLHRDLRASDIFHPNAPLQEQPWGMREFGILDLYGNLITFFERSEA